MSATEERKTLHRLNEAWRRLIGNAVAGAAASPPPPEISASEPPEPPQARPEEHKRR